MKAAFLPPATKELSEAFDWYEAQFPGLGLEFMREIEATVRRISEWPETAGKLGRYLRRALVRRFPYGLIYGVEEDAVIIIAVAHLHRKPFYWETRHRRWRH